ncbi:MAG: sensor histidine kinase [Lachnospiraceae bacterium]|nr:sensor histidine kinase [Lachnospiraceae bacterium]
MTVGFTLFAMVLITVIFHISSTRQIRRESIANNTQSLERMENELSSQVHKLSVKMQTIYTEESLINNMRNRLADGGNLRYFYWTAGNFVKNRFTTSDELMAMYIYDSKSRLVSSYRSNVVYYPYDIYTDIKAMNGQVVLNYVDSDETEILLSGYYNETAKKSIVRMVMKLHDYDGNRREYGYIVCDFDGFLFTDIMSKYCASDALVWIQPLGDQPIATLHGESENAYFDAISGSILLAGNTGDVTLQEEYGDFYLCSTFLEKYGLYSVMLMPSSLVLKTQQTLIRTLILVSLLMLIITFLVSMAFTRIYSKPVEEMKDKIIKIREGDMSLRVKPVGWSEELELLGVEFNDMLDQIQNMITEKYETELLVKRTQYQALQAQVNPHFLYNTLDTMSGIANSQNCFLVSNLCQSLSAIFRYSLDISDSLSNMEKELIHVKNYLYVMDVRNGYQTGYDYQVDDEIMDDCIPRITLQPIVENAISHGLRPSKKDTKHITVKARHAEGNLLIEITDNGIGMETEALNEALKENSLDRVETGDSIGILNVNARIKKAFGNAYGVSVESVPQEGTTVKLVMPIRKEYEIGTETI